MGGSGRIERPKPMTVSLPPLIEPNERISRIRLSESPVRRRASGTRTATSVRPWLGDRARFGAPEVWLGLISLAGHPHLLRSAASRDDKCPPFASPAPAGPGSLGRPRVARPTKDRPRRYYGGLRLLPQPQPPPPVLPACAVGWRRLARSTPLGQTSQPFLVSCLPDVPLALTPPEFGPAADGFPRRTLRPSPRRQRLGSLWG